MTTDGLIAIRSANDYAATVRKLNEAFDGHGIKPFATIDHAAAAAGVGLDLTPILLILFGNPKVGTRLMQEQPTIGIDLPLKLLVWVDGDTTYIGYNDPKWFADRHAVTHAPEVLDGMTALLRKLAELAAEA